MECRYISMRQLNCTHQYMHIIYMQLGCLHEYVSSLSMQITLGQNQITKLF